MNITHTHFRLNKFTGYFCGQCLLAALLILATTPSLSAERSWKADHIKVQFAGNIGLLAIGVGKQVLQNRLHSDILYGHVPHSLAGRDLHILAFKNSYHFTRSTRTRLPLINSSYIGATIFYTHKVDVNTLTDEFNGVSSLPPNTLHIMPYLGISLNDPAQQTSSLFLELGVLDTYFEDYLNNRVSERYSLLEFSNLAIGIRRQF
jgi:hypothetical protein